MLKLLVLLVLLAGGAAAASYVPIHGRTVLDRWYAARDAGDFVERAWAEATAAFRSPDAPAQARGRTADRSRSRAPAPATRPNRPPLPTETHTDADRAALDRIVAERAGR